MSIIRQNEPAKRPSFEAQMVISSFLTRMEARVQTILELREQQAGLDAFYAKKGKSKEVRR